MSFSHSLEIREKIVKPIEILLSNDSEIDEITGITKDPLEVLDIKIDQAHTDELKTRKICRDDGLIYYLSQKPGKVEYLDLQHKMEHKLRMLICVTIYNETKSELYKTLQGIMENLESFLDHSISPYDIAVVVIFDGILKMDESMRTYFSTLDQELLLNSALSIESRLAEIKKSSDAYIKAAEKSPLDFQKRKKEVAQGSYLGPTIPKRTSICYQIQLGVRDFAECSLIRRPEYLHLAKLNVFLCVKMVNKQKLSSHLWFFQGFCKTFQPEYCCLVDCGTKPEKEGIWNFFRALETDIQVGGVCGYMGVRIEEENNKIKQLPFKFDVEGSENFIYRGYLHLVNFILLLANYFIGGLEKVFSIQKAQEFEYCFAHIFDKGFESFFGFIAVLPGAWSAYRWDALSEDNLLEREYLQTVLDPNYYPKSIREANKLLAEDRLLCLAIFTKRNRSYLLKYIPDAEARTDLIDTITKLLGQRKRWINGTWYALEYVIQYQNQIRFSKHSLARKILFSFSMFMARIGMYTTYYMIATFLVTLYILVFEYFGVVNAISDSNASLAGFFILIFLGMIFTVIFLSLQFQSNNPSCEFLFRLLSHLLGLLSLMTFGLMISLLFGEIFQDPTGYFINQNLMRGLMIATASCYVLVVLVNPSKIPTILCCLPHYIYYTPTYLHIMVIYAFCRIDDLSWGTKGASGGPAGYAGNQKEFKDFKVKFVADWILYNSIIIYIVLVLINSGRNKDYFMSGLLIFITIIIFIKSIFAFLNQVKFVLFDKTNYFHRLKEKKEKYMKQTKKIQEFFDQILQPREMSQRSNGQDEEIKFGISNSGFNSGGSKNLKQTNPIF